MNSHTQNGRNIGKTSGTIGIISGSDPGWSETSSQPQRAYVCRRRSKEHVVGRRWCKKSSLVIGQQGTFFKPKLEWVAASSSTVNPGERKFIVDSGASIHVMSKTDLSPEGRETVKVNRLPTTLITPNESIDTTEEAIVYVKGLDTFVTVQLLEDTPAVRSPGNSAKNMGGHTSELECFCYLSSKSNERTRPFRATTRTR